MLPESRAHSPMLFCSGRCRWANRLWHPFAAASARGISAIRQPADGQSTAEVTAASHLRQSPLAAARRRPAQTFVASGMYLVICLAAGEALSLPSAAPRSGDLAVKGAI